MGYYNNIIEYDDNYVSGDTRLKTDGNINGEFFSSYRYGRFAVRKDYDFTAGAPSYPGSAHEIRAYIYNKVDNTPFDGFQWNSFLLYERDVNIYSPYITDWQQAVNKTMFLSGSNGGYYYTPSLGASDGLHKIRRIKNWIYDKIAITPKIYGVYFDRLTRDDFSQNVRIHYGYTLKEFFDNKGIIPSTYNNIPLLGYIIKFEFTGYNSDSNTSPILCIGMPMVCGVHSAVNETDESLAYTTIQGYALNPNDIIVGGYQNTRPVNSEFTGTVNFSGCRIGSISFEGLPLVTETRKWYELNGYNWGCVTQCIMPEDMDAYILTDFANMALSLGFPVLASREAMNDFSINLSIVHCVESTNPDIYDYVFYPKVANGRIDNEEYYRGKNIETSSGYKKAKEQSTQRIDDEDVIQVTEIIGQVPDNPTDVDTNEYVEEIPLNEPKITPVGIFSRWYALTEYDVLDLYNFIYTNDENQIARIMKGLELNGENPMNFIISLRMYPFALNDFIDLESEQEIGFGNGVNTGVIAERITSSSFTLDLGKVKFPTYNKNFLDYAPYTNAKLYIPYCGEVSLDTSIYVGHTVSIRMIVDLTSGLCCAVIYRDGIPALYKDGHMAMDIQLTGTNATEFVSSYSNALGNLLSGAVEVGVGAHMIAGGELKGMQSVNMGSYNTATRQYETGKNVLIEDRRSNNTTIGALREFGGIGKMIEGAYEWNNTPTPLQLSGQSAPLLDLFKPQFAYLVIETAKVISTNNYGNSYGYACLEYGKISALADGTLVAAKNVNITPPNATLPEIAEIKELLESGVWK